MRTIIASIKSIADPPRFYPSLMVIFFATAFNTVYLLKDSANGLSFKMDPWHFGWLLYGPFIYYAGSHQLHYQIKRWWLHLLPFGLGLIFAIIAPTGLFNLAAYANLFVFVAVFPYLLYVAIKAKKKSTALTTNAEMLLLIVAMLMFICLSYLALHVLKNPSAATTGINLRFFPYGALVVLLFLLMVNLGFGISLVRKTQKQPTSPYQHHVLSAEQANKYRDQIETFLTHQKAFLDAGLTPEKMAVTLNIPKYLISTIFNVHFGNSFYGHIASYRISYAIQQMDNGQDHFKIETLSEQAGFNSKTSFYRYFKAHTGFTPYQYMAMKKEK